MRIRQIQPCVLTRRDVVKGLAAAPLMFLVGCVEREGSRPSGSDAGHTGDYGVGEGDVGVVAHDAGADATSVSGPDAGDSGEADASEEDLGAEDVGVAAGEWATGGTSAMVNPRDYPNPFGVPAACALTCASTLGPCHVASPERVDISDGWDGLPVRLALRVLDESCEPIEDAIVEIWHTNHRGSYSGQAAALCNESVDDSQRGYFRGWQRTDGRGEVRFDTCYPGWYGGRAIHVHFRVMTGTYDGDDDAAAIATSQLFFPDDLNAEIFEREPVYRDFGLPNRTNETDGIFGSAVEKERYICEYAKMADGAMQAWATIVVRSLSPDGCRL